MNIREKVISLKLQGEMRITAFCLAVLVFSNNDFNSESSVM